MARGPIVRLLTDKGFGVIRDEAGVEHFFNKSAVKDGMFESLRHGQRVEFNVEESTKGPRDCDVRAVES